MKWNEILALIISLGLLMQLVMWAFKSIGVTENIGSVLTFFLVVIFSFLIVFSLILIQFQKEIKKIKRFLKKQSIKNNMGKRGMIDARILLVMLGLTLLYLMWAAGWFNWLF